MLRFVSVFGLLTFLALAWALSENRKAINWRLVIWALGLQLAIGFLFLKTPVRDYVFDFMAGVVAVLTNSTLEGARFVFGDLPDQIPVAFQVLPVIIFVAALSAMLYHVGIIQILVRGIAAIMRRTLKTSGAETLGAALLIFVGIEAVAAIRAYLTGMTRSELAAIMSTFMATIAGSVMIIYANFGAEPGHLLTASLMSAPAALLISKMLVPETETPQTAGAGHVPLPIESHNLLDAATRGTADGLKMALSVGATLLVFVGLVYLFNLFLGAITSPFMADPLTFQQLMGYIFRPFAYLMGVPSTDTAAVAELLGTKSVLNEFLGYAALQGMNADASTALSPRATMIATYALCGFANPGSIGIMIAGLDALAPDRRKDVTSMSIKAYIAGTIACFMTACVAGIMLYD